MADSERTCPECQAGREPFCPNLTLTYYFPAKHLTGQKGGARCSLYEAPIGGIRETQEMPDFCSAHDVTSE
jgi:hypothetical protein